MTEPALPLLASSTGAHLHLMAMQCQQDLALLEVLHRVTAADAESLTAVAVAMEALAARIRQVHPVQRLDPDGTHRATLSLCVDKAGLLQHIALHRAKGAPKVPLQLQMAQALNQLAPACDQLVKAVAAHDDALERVDPLPTSAPQPAD